MVDFDEVNGNLQVFLNCKKETIEKILEQPAVKRDEYMISTGQNILEFIQPTEMFLPFEYFVNQIIETSNSDSITDDFKKVGSWGTLTPVMDLQTLK